MARRGDDDDDAELIASNEMEVVHASTVAGIAEVRHWDGNGDGDGDAGVSPPLGMFWRRTFDITTGEFGEV